ncbi:hypothetical protein A2U01_0115115, partial [Trifolium medium]|nr:hypothetical protein [Trifolium medium]
IESNGDQTWELVGLLEVVGYMKSLMLRLVKPPKIPRLVGGKQIFKSMENYNPGFEEGTV